MGKLKELGLKIDEFSGARKKGVVIKLDVLSPHDAFVVVRRYPFSPDKTGRTFSRRVAIRKDEGGKPLKEGACVIVSGGMYPEGRGKIEVEYTAEEFEELKNNMNFGSETKPRRKNR